LHRGSIRWICGFYLICIEDVLQQMLRVRFAPHHQPIRFAKLSDPPDSDTTVKNFCF
jgi:hypothetical protein